MQRVLLLFLCLNFGLLIAQQPKPCADPASNQFDFWLGSWEGSWTIAGKKGMAKNTITKILNNCVIQEQFVDTDTLSPLLGLSNSVYIPALKKWKQTWVDNSGAYLDFSGEWDGDKMVLSRIVQQQDKSIIQRMVWYDIAEDSFEWNWESSADGGETWKVNWQIHYTRLQ